MEIKHEIINPKDWPWDNRFNCQAKFIHTRVIEVVLDTINDTYIMKLEIIKPKK